MEASSKQLDALLSVLRDRAFRAGEKGDARHFLAGQEN
jgi:hypothetical protein